MSFNKGIFVEHSGIWVEKYRPKSLSEYIGNKEMKEKFQTFIDRQEIPNLLLEGPAGTGKSSVANLLVKEINCDFKYINASNENGIETVRNKIAQFCTTSGFSEIKILVLDEFSEFSFAGQAALRAILEQHTKYIRFILTCNSVERILDPIRSRCQEFKVIPPTKDEVLKRCLFILESEKVEFEKHEVDSIIDFNYPDIRKCIQLLEQQTLEKDGNKVLKLDKEFFKLLKYQEKLITILKTIKKNNILEKVTEIRQVFADSRIKNYQTVYRHLFDKIDDYTPKGKMLKVIILLEDGLKYDSFIADKEINIVATILSICEELVGE